LKRGVEILDVLFLLRPTLFYPIWTFFLAGTWGGMRFGTGVGDLTHPVGPLWVVVGLTLVMGGVFILNQIQDVETDRVNGKLFLLANGIVPVKAAYQEATLMMVCGLALGFWIDFRIGLGFLILVLLSGWLYNYPPTRWKNRPIMGLVVNGMGGLVIYSLGWMVGGGRGFVVFRAVIYALAGVAVFLNTTLPDREGDEKTGKITFGVRYGIKRTVVLALAVEICAVGLALLFRDWLLFFPGLVVLPLFVLSAVKRTLAEVIRATKFSVLALAVAVCVVFPLYLLPVFIVFFLSKWYYGKRFDFNYPSFRSS